MRTTKEQLERELAAARRVIDDLKLQVRNADVAANQARQDYSMYREKAERLEKQVLDLHTAALRKETDHREELRRHKIRASAPFTRGDIEGFTAEQLTSLGRECITEARRRDMLEAEGMVGRYFQFLDATDLEMLENMQRGFTKLIEVRKKVAEDRKRSDDIQNGGLRARFNEYKGAAGIAGVPVCSVMQSRGTGTSGNVDARCGRALIRNQCPEHAEEWVGEERCVCGLSFRFCKSKYADTFGRQQLDRIGHKPEIQRNTVRVSER